MPQLLDWLLLEDSMTKRFEQQGKTVSVTMIREGFVEQNEIPEELPLLPKESRYWLREISVMRRMVNRGLPVVPLFRRCQRYAGRSWRYKNWVKRR